MSINQSNLLSTKVKIQQLNRFEKKTHTHKKYMNYTVPKKTHTHKKYMNYTVPRSCKNLACREETHISRGCFQKVSSLSPKN